MIMLDLPHKQFHKLGDETKKLNASRGVRVSGENCTPLYGLYRYVGAKGYGFLAVLSNIIYN